MINALIEIKMIKNNKIETRMQLSWIPMGRVCERRSSGVNRKLSDKAFYTASLPGRISIWICLKIRAPLFTIEAKTRKEPVSIDR